MAIVGAAATAKNVELRQEFAERAVFVPELDRIADVEVEAGVEFGVIAFRS